jgi:hypothetical protein
MLLYYVPRNTRDLTIGPEAVRGWPTKFVLGANRNPINLSGTKFSEPLKMNTILGGSLIIIKNTKIRNLAALCHFWPSQAGKREDL